MRSKYMVGATGFLALFGFLGFFIEARVFLCFFVFAVNFVYFLVKDERVAEAFIRRTATDAFCFGCVAMALIAMCFFVIGESASSALVGGVAGGWACALVYNASKVLFYSLRDR